MLFIFYSDIGRITFNYSITYFYYVMYIAIDETKLRHYKQTNANLNVNFCQ